MRGKICKGWDIPKFIQNSSLHNIKRDVHEGRVLALQFMALDVPTNFEARIFKDRNPAR